jgi:hypothetical protein
VSQFGVLDGLARLAQDQKSSRARQGALLAYERLFSELGSKFEPYVVVVLPCLLNLFGDTNPVRVVQFAASLCCADASDVTGRAGGRARRRQHGHVGADGVRHQDGPSAG